MRNQRFHVLKLLATLAMIASISGLFSLSASAAPGSIDAGTRVQAQSVDLCVDLLDRGVIDEDGNLIGIYADLDAAGLVTALLALDIDIDLTVALNILDGGCAGVSAPAPTTGVLSGTVTDTDGNPLAGASVCEDGGGCSETDASGAFSAGEVAFGEYTLTASLAGFAPQTLTVEVDAEGGFFAFVLEPTEEPGEPTTGVLSGTVTDTDGNALAGASVCEEGGGCSATDASGAFSAGEVALGEYTLTASLAGYVSQTLTGEVGEDGGFFAFELAPVEAPGEDTGTVTVLKYVCDDLDEAVWGAEPGEDCVPGTAHVVFTEQLEEGLGSSYDLVVDGEASTDLPAGDYEVTENGTFSSTTITVVAGETQTLTLLNPGTPEVETFPVTIVADTEDDGSAEGAIVTIEEDLDVALFMAAQAAPVTGEIGDDNTFTTDLPAGDYIATIDATAQGYGISSTAFSVPTDDTVLVDLVPLETMGTVLVENVYCGDIDAVTFNPTFSLDDCVHGAGTFSFYLQGDGTAEYMQLNVWEDGIGSIDLAPGTYTMVVEGTGAEFDVVVTSGETTTVVVANPGEAPAPRDGTVNVSAFVCNNIDQVIFSSDSFMTTFALPTHEPACDPGTATLTFYLIGDGTDDHWQVVADPTGSITLAPGNYEVVEEGTQARTFITVVAGDFITLDVQIPAGGEVVPGNSVNIVKFYCDTVTETEFQTFGLADLSDRDQLAAAPDCVSGPATFTFYLVGDGTADYAQIWVDGAGSIGLDPGTYEVVEEETQAHFTFDVLDGENTVLVVNNPLSQLPEAPEEPVTPEQPGEGETGGVSELPSTGSGHADSNSTYALAAAAAALLAGAGAFVLRRDEAA